MKIESSPRVLHDTCQGATPSWRLAGDRHDPSVFHTFPEWPPRAHTDTRADAHTRPHRHTCTQPRTVSGGGQGQARRGGQAEPAVGQSTSPWTGPGGHEPPPGLPETRSREERRRSDSAHGHHRARQNPVQPHAPMLVVHGHSVPRSPSAGRGAFSAETAKVQHMSAQGTAWEPSNVGGLGAQDKSTKWTHPDKKGSETRPGRLATRPPAGPRCIDPA